MNAETTQLNGWKEIACYLRRSVRCVQRWEKKEGLPVYRHTHSYGASVYAIPADLDVWWQTEQRCCAQSNLPINLRSGEGKRRPTRSFLARRDTGRADSLARQAAESEFTAQDVTLLLFLLKQWKTRDLSAIIGRAFEKAQKSA